MQRALFDTSVLFAAAYERDEHHDEGLPILRGASAGDLPTGVVLDLVLAETLNGLTSTAGHEAAVDFLDRLERSDRFLIQRCSDAELTSAKRTFRRYERLSFVDASLVAYAENRGIGYCYAFDDDFDAVEGFDRLDAAVDPYEPS